MSDTNPKAEPFSNAEKDPHDWTTGDEKMTGAQASYLKTLSEESATRRGLVRDRGGYQICIVPRRKRATDSPVACPWR
ncbi:MAG: DUF3072 domain-containing protein, partial [Sphingomonas sp.]